MLETRILETKMLENNKMLRNKVSQFLSHGGAPPKFKSSALLIGIIHFGPSAHCASGTS